MTPREEPRRMRRQSGEGNGARGAEHVAISTRLRLAREARGVDLFRVERDTKIRVKFLSALELGLFSELPAEVYARGFLRNYASYLGMDPDEAWEEWRREAATPRPAAVAAATDARLPATQVGAGAAASTPAGSVATTAGSVVPGAQAPGNRTFVLNVPQLRLPQLKLPAMGRGAAKVPPAEQAQGRPPKPEASILESPPLKRRFLGLPAVLPWPRGSATESPIGGPQPIPMPRRSLLFGPTHVVILLLVVVIVAVGLFFGLQAQRVLQDPLLSVSQPAQAVTYLPSGTTTYQISGTATPKAEISISWDQRDPILTLADATGAWTFKATVHDGINQFDIFSVDLETTHHSKTATLLITVSTPSASPVQELLTVDSPTDGQVFTNGNITLYGSSVSITSVLVTTKYLGAAPPPAPSGQPTRAPTPTPRPTPIPTIMPVATPAPLPTATATPRPTASPSGSVAPEPAPIIPTIDGRFSAPLHLTSGRWLITVVGTNSQGVSATPVELTVIVTAGSLVVVVDVKGAPGADLKIWKDGKVLPGFTPFKRFAPGKSVKVVADQSVWIFSAIPRNTYVTINDVSFGQLGTGRSGASWRITGTGPPVLSNDR